MTLPTITKFNPRHIKWQFELIKDLRKNFVYKKWNEAKQRHECQMHEILLSGAVGSSKSAILTHSLATHAVAYPRSVVGIGRLSMPSLKGTLYNMLCQHFGKDIKIKTNSSTAHIYLPNKSEIIAHSWSDKRYKKVRSYEFTAYGIEELTETEDKGDSQIAAEFYDEIKMRVGRYEWPESWIMSASNPGDPSHWAYNYFIQGQNETKHVYYSKTEDNIFLNPAYIQRLRETLDPLMARRMLHGEWLSISGDVIYHQYDPAIHFLKQDYEINPRFPIFWSHDFNIGEKKPMSNIFFQHINGVFHFFKEIVIKSARTADVCEEALEFISANKNCKFIITGDASGSSRDTRSTRSDYEIITQFLSKHMINFELRKPASNPSIRVRHNKVNATLKNDLGQVRMYIYKDCKVADEGMRLTKLKEKASYIEDDSNHYQHVTTAIGYGIMQATQERVAPQWI